MHVVGDGSSMTRQSYATGGKNGDMTIMARATADTLDARGYPMLQSSDTSHTTVVELPTLVGCAQGDVKAGGRPDVTYQISVGEEYDVHVGDHATLTIEDDFLGRRTLDLKITDVSGSSDSEWLTLQARELI